MTEAVTSRRGHTGQATSTPFRASTECGHNRLEAFDAMIGEGSYAILTGGADAQAAGEVE
jgi:hypothetical protein